MVPPPCVGRSRPAPPQQSPFCDPTALGECILTFSWGKHDNPLQFRWIGLREHLQESPIFNWKFDGFRLSFSLKPLKPILLNWVCALLSDKAVSYYQ